VERLSLALEDNKLVREASAAMSNRQGLWFGKFTMPVQLNTSTIANFWPGDGRSEYVRT